jgi:archaetidylinositol phosphate synthase
MLSRLKPVVSRFSAPVTSLIARAGLKPNHLTIMGLIFGILAAFFIAQKVILLGAILILVSSIFDMLDGALARTQEMASEFGGFLDSVIDRYVDVLIFISLGIYGVDWVIVALAMSGALLVSYTRARAEKIIEKCDVGIAERGERLLIVFFGLILGYAGEAVLLIAVLSHLTALHRIIYTFKESKRLHRE